MSMQRTFISRRDFVKALFLQPSCLSMNFVDLQCVLRSLCLLRKQVPIFWTHRCLCFPSFPSQPLNRKPRLRSCLGAAWCCPGHTRVTVVKEVFTNSHCTAVSKTVPYSYEFKAEKDFWSVVASHKSNSVLSALDILLGSPNLDKSSNSFSETSLEYMSDSIEM